MSIAELKKEAIHQFAVKMDAMEDEAELKVVLDFLNGIHLGDDNGLNLSRHYESIKLKHSSILEKLAQ